ncbi:MAG: hypothetical protein N4A35_06610 [Flavobacteriales bacterium]|jgi:hypothetical protein|nr:hypothetical protein [Flavobacteriales bacterium]
MELSELNNLIKSISPVTNLKDSKIIFDNLLGYISHKNELNDNEINILNSLFLLNSHIRKLENQDTSLPSLYTKFSTKAGLALRNILAENI